MRRLAQMLALVVAAGCGANETPAPEPGDGDVVFECLPNLDGVVEADEMPVATDLSVDYLVTKNAPVSLEGSVDERGVRVWSFAGESAADTAVTFTAVPLLGQWYADDFPGGDFVLATDTSGAIEGVYRKDDAGLYLLGLASREANPAGGQTRLVYDEPVALFRFPLGPGDAWTEIRTIDGVLNGLPYNAEDTYDVEVDATGEIQLPYVRFTQAHRVRTRVNVEPAAGGVTVTTRQVSFVFECFGEVARATSAEGEMNENFETAAELRRFAL